MRKYNLWDEDDLHYLRKAYAEGVSINQMAKVLQREKVSVYVKAHRLGLKRDKIFYPKNRKSRKENKNAWLVGQYFISNNLHELNFSNYGFNYITVVII